jgi:Fic family protein
MNYADTSREAWRSFLPVSHTLDDMIIAALKAFPEGLVCDEIEKIIERSHQAVSGNLRHLVERGVVVNTGAKGRTSSGRSAIRWGLTNVV